jgi:hypothetical protein
MSRSKKLLRAALAIGVAGAAAAFGTLSAFTATTVNPDNEISTGTVEISDNDSNAAMYSLPNAKPGPPAAERCIRVTYTGTLDADVKLYTASSFGDLGPYVDLEVTPGTQATSTFPGCSGFTPAAGGSVYDGTLAGFASAHSSWANGLVVNPQGVAKWELNDAVVFRFRVTVQDVPAAAGKQTGQHSFTWEARNQ